MDLGIVMYEMCLMQWPGWEREMDVWDEVGPGLADDIIAEIKNKQSPSQVLGNNKHNPNQS